MKGIFEDKLKFDARTTTIIKAFLYIFKIIIILEKMCQSMCPHYKKNES